MLALAASLVALATPQSARAAVPFSSASGTCVAPGNIGFTTSGTSGSYADVAVHLTTTGAPGTISLDDASTANFGADDSVWLSYGYSFGVRRRSERLRNH